MRGRLFTGAVATAAVAFVSAAHAQTPDPTLYCQGDGGPLGIATDLEHGVLTGEPPLPPGVRTSRVSVAGVETRVQEAGPAGAEEAVVFVHGHPGSSRDFDPLLAATGEFARAVAIDVPGYGQSDKGAAQVQSIDGVAGYIHGLLDRLGVRRAVLVLHDFGGPWGLQWASQHPDALNGVVLLNTGVLIDWVPHALAVVWATPGAGELQMASTTRESFHQAVQFRNPRPLPTEFVDRMYDDYDRATRCAALRHYRSGAASGDFARAQAAVLRRRSRPALVIWGEQDPYIAASHAEGQRAAFPDARVEIFPDSAHWAFIDNAERTRGLVVPFLRPRITASRPAGVRAGRRRLRVPLAVEGMLPAHEVRIRLERAGRQVGGSGAARTVTGDGVLVVRARRPLRRGRYALVLSARGLPGQRLRVRVAGGRRPRPQPADGPRYTG